MAAHNAWWEGDGRSEHLLDVALPHEDHEEPADPATGVAWPAKAAFTGIVLGFTGLAGYLLVHTANLWS